jgi:hypothetical protein
MTLLSTLVPSLQREIAVPGTFADVFPDTSDDDLVDTLADGFAEAQLWGFFPTMSLVEAGDDWDTSEDLSPSGGVLIVYYAAARIIRAQLRNLNTVERYKAGPAEVEFQRAASVLKDELDYLTSRIADLVVDAKRGTIPLAHVHDNYWARSLAGAGLPIAAGWYPWEL